MFRAYYPEGDRLVAIKVFQLDLLPEQVHALAAELQKLVGRRLAHPGIVAPIAAGVQGASVYLAQEFCGGESLDVAMRQGERWTGQAGRDLVHAVASAIDVAAADGVHHGALHPRDILLAGETVRVTGFGVTEALERVGLRVLGRHPYGAPERTTGQPWGTPADVFALAVLAYELLANRRVSGIGEQGIEQLAALQQADVFTLRQVFTTALATDPAARYRTARGFISGLDASLRAQAVPAADGLLEPRLPLDVADEDEIDEPESAAAKTAAPRIVAGPVLVPEPEAEIDAGLARDPAEDEPEPEPPLESELELNGGGELEDPLARAEILPADVPAAAGADRAPAAGRDAFVPDIPEIEEAAEIDRAPGDLVIGPRAPAPPARDTAPAAAAVPLPASRPAADGAPPRAARPQRPPSLLDSPPVVVEPIGEPQRTGNWPIFVALTVGLLVGFAIGVSVVSFFYGPGSAAPAASASAPAPVTSAPASETSAQAPATPAAQAQAPASVRPAAPRAAPAVPVSGRLVMRSTPAGAHVILNGRERGTTPLSLSGLPVGAYRVRFEHAGYLPQEQRAVLSASHTEQTVALRLWPAPPASGPGILVVDSRPTGATVLLDGARIGTTPLVLPGVASGAHGVRLEMPGYRPWVSSVDIKTGESNRVTASLEQGSGR